MTTSLDWINETRGHLFGGTEPELNRLDGSINSSVTTFTTEFNLGSMTSGAIISIDLEEIRIWSTSGSTTVTVCERGVNGTTAASHSDAAVIEVRPRFSNFKILRALNQDLDDLSSPINGLFKVNFVDLTYNASQQAYNLTSATNVLDILEARYKLTGSSREWPLLKGWDTLRTMDTDFFTSGFGISLREAAEPGQQFRVWYSGPFTALSTTDTTVNVNTTGLPTSAYDLPPMGAALRLMAGKEINRNFMESQGDPRRSEEVPPGAIAQATQSLERLRLRRIQAESARLQSDWRMSK